MQSSKEPLNAARGITLGCLFSGVIWLSVLNVVLYTHNVPL